MPVNTRIQLRRGTAAAGANQWTNQVLYAGEVGYETDTGKFKIGDGTTAWNSLGYASVLPSELDELVEDIIGSHVVGGSGISVSYNDTNGNTTVSLSDPTIQASDVTDFSEAVDDRVSNLLVAGSNITLTYNDNANTLTIAAGGTSTEDVQDIIGSSVIAGSGISVTYNDSAGTTTVALSDPTIQVADITDLTASATELNYLTGASPGAPVSNTAVIYNSDLEVVASGIDIVGYTTSGSIFSVSRDAINSVYDIKIGDSDPGYNVNIALAGTNLSINGTTLTSTATELNLLDGSAANTVVNSKAVIYGSSGEVAASSVTTTGNVTVGGNLIVNGTTTTVNSTTVTVDDPIFTIGGDTAPSTDDNKDRGIEFRYHNGTSAKVGFFGYDDSTGKFTFIPDATNSSEVFSGTKGEVDANVDWSNVLNKPDPVITVTLTGEVTGTANATLTDLGNGTVTVNTTISADSVALGTDTTGNYVASITNGSYITGGNGGSEGAALTLAVDATSTNTASKVVARDSSGDFAAGNITATGLTNATLTNCVIDGGTP